MEGRICPVERLERLLLTTDCSEFSEGAVREGIRLAKDCGTKVYVMSVIEYNPELEALAPNLVEEMESEASACVKSVKERADREGVACETLITRSGTPHASIVDEAHNLKANMIVMGRRGRTGMKRLLMGSVTARVVGYSPVNVFVVPRAAKTEFKNILVATDGSAFSDAAVREAICMAKCTGGSVTAISVARTKGEDVRDNVEKARRLGEKEGLKVEAVTEVGRHYEVIVQRAEEKNIDLIVMGSHGKTGLDRLLMGSVTEKVIGLASCAVLVTKV
jgi:nucleotide-binding universal stress UspA family protein